MDGHPRLMARDALHAAACRTARAGAICRDDADLDAIAGLRHAKELRAGRTHAAEDESRAATKHSSQNRYRRSRLYNSQRSSDGSRCD